MLYPAQQTEQLQLKAYYSVDWGACLKTRKSLTGLCVLLGRALISRKTKKQNVFSRSSAKAKYRSITQTGCEQKRITHLLTQFGIKV